MFIYDAFSHHIHSYHDFPAPATTELRVIVRSKKIIYLYDWAEFDKSQYRDAKNWFLW